MLDDVLLQLPPAADLAQTVADLHLWQPLVVALSPSGLALAAPLSRALQAPLDVLLTCEPDPAASAAPHRPLLHGRSVVLVGDDPADAPSWRAAIDSLLSMEPARLVVAAPPQPAAAGR